MCPVCLAAGAAMVAASATTTGGLAALVLRVTRRPAKDSERNQKTEGEPHAPVPPAMLGELLASIRLTKRGEAHVARGAR